MPKAIHDADDDEPIDREAYNGGSEPSHYVEQTLKKIRKKLAQQKMERITHEDDDKVLVCPYCDTPSVGQRKGDTNGRKIDKECEYVCYKCKRGFNSPKEREAYDGPSPSAILEQRIEKIKEKS